MNTIIDFLKQKDKQQHIATQFLTKLFLTGVIYGLFELAGFAGLFALLIAALTAALITLSIGIAKEIYDFYHPATHTADVWDIVADSVGVYAGLALVFVLAYLRFYK